MAEELTWAEWQTAKVEFKERNQLRAHDGDAWLAAALDPVSDHTREVFANAGLALYLAQVLEHGLVNLVAAARAAQGSFNTPDDVDATFGGLFGKTMGGQLRAALEAVSFTPAQIEGLREALALRNYLAHHFFRERIDDFATEDGRNGLTETLVEMQERFQAVDRELEPHLFRLFAQSGITREVFDSEFAQLQRELDADSPG
jgi:hypothetical protein